MQLMPSKSGSSQKFSSVPPAPRPPIHAPGAWQRMQNSPANATSWLAIASDACQIGSRALCAIMLATQVRTGAAFGS